MIHKNKNKKNNIINLSSKDLLLSIDYSKKINLDKLIDINSRYNFLDKKNNDLLKIKIEGDTIPDKFLKIDKVSENINHKLKFISLDFKQKFKKDDFKGRISIIQKRENVIDFVFQLSVSWNDDIPKKTSLIFPFLQNLANHKFFLKPGHISDGSKTLKKSVWNFHEYPPAILSNNSGKTAIGIEFYDQFPWQANYNLGMHEAISSDNFEKYEAEVQLNQNLSDVIVMRLYTSSKGRNDIFNLWKANTRSRYDLRKYFRPQNMWIKKNYITHFTFAYGKESFHYKKTKFNIKKIIKEGLEFGGYDSLIFWHQYPRLGLDNTNQWEMYKYLPEEYESIQKIVKECHKNKIKFFIPFKPWDVKSNESLDYHAKSLEDFIARTNIDGFFLDTMSSLPDSFLTIQKKFPSFEFASEGTPREQRQIEQLTSSWDQIGDIRRNYKVQVEANMFRFVFPEHPLNMVSRWSVGSDKDSIIKRAAFNGMGLVIWQDVFGSWLPFNKKQKQLIKKLKNVLNKYHNIIFGSNSVPLIETLSKGLICNKFCNDNNQKIFAIYNFTNKNIKGPLFDLESKTKIKFQQIFGVNSEMQIKKIKKIDTMFGTVPADEVILIYVKY
jgi:hypothetical protein